MQDRYKIAEIEKAADEVVWCSDEAPGFVPGRAQDKSFVGNIVAAMEAYGAGRLGEREIQLREIDRIVAIGSDGMMAAGQRARHRLSSPPLQPAPPANAPVKPPAQCKLKKNCAHVLPLHKDPAT